MNICLRIKDIVVNTIHNTGQHIGTCLQQLIQLLSVKLCLNLFRIGLTDSSHTICIDNTALQKIHITVCFQLVRCKITVRNTNDILNNILIIDSLESEIVNRHDSLDILIKWVGLECIVQIYRHQCCLPVMAVNNVRSEINRRERTQDSS